MSSGQALQMDFGAVGAGPLLETPQWFAIRTRSRHEKTVADQLERQKIESFLPLVKTTHKWSDRKKEVELPLFSGSSACTANSWGCRFRGGAGDRDSGS